MRSGSDQQVGIAGLGWASAKKATQLLRAPFEDARECTQSLIMRTYVVMQGDQDQPEQLLDHYSGSCPSVQWRTDRRGTARPSDPSQDGRSLLLSLAVCTPRTWLIACSFPNGCTLVMGLVKNRGRGSRCKCGGFGVGQDSCIE